MSSRRPRTAHQEAVQRRLALLSAELAGVRDAAPVDGRAGDPVPGGAGGRPEPPPEPTYDPGLEHTRVAAPRRAALLAPPVAAPVVDPAAEDADSPRPVPRPGRHAARRPGRAAAALPEALLGRFALGPATLAVVAVLAAAGLGVTCWVVVRADARPVAAPRLSSAGLATPAVPADAAETGSPPPSGAPSSAPGEVTVDVTGRVRRPGIVVLPAGSRVVDALEEAGGARPRVDLSSLNLARVLTDGEQVVVGVSVPAPAGAGPAPASTAAPGPAAPLVDLNTADEAQLDTLPEVGPVTAGAIVAWRTEHGGFTSVEELLEVDGIGDATLAQIAPYVTV